MVPNFFCDVLNVKPLSHVLTFPRAPWYHSEIWYFSWRWRCHGVSTATYGDLMATLAFLRISMRSYGVLVDDCLRSHGASTACIGLSRRAQCVCTVCSRRSLCADGVLFTFGSSYRSSGSSQWYSVVTMHQPSAFVKPYSNPKLTTPRCPPPSSSHNDIHWVRIILQNLRIGKQ